MKMWCGWVLILIGLLPYSASCQSPCINGFAAGYECSQVDLLAHITPSDIYGAVTNEVWGWTDPLDNTEYVILGTSIGVVFFNIADPIHPALLGSLPTHTVNSAWRSFRTYNNYLFVVSEASGHGMQVFDLTRLRDVASPPETFTEDAHYDGFGNCHTLAICDETGFAFACGTSTYLGGPHIVNIQNPLNPIIAGGYEVNGSTHESVVMVYDGPDPDYQGKTIAFCFNGAVPLPVTILDVTDPSDIQSISTTSYPGQKYCHQGWLTEDKYYLLIDDELDEYYNEADSLHTHIFDVHDLDFPVYMGYHVGGSTIDHNQYVVGNLDFQSNYTDGLDILDVSDIADTTLKRVAYFDHFPGDPEAFQGEWMNYPFFNSGVVAVTDIYNGMFLLQPNFIQVESPDTICSNEVYTLQINLGDGFIGPYELILTGLPLGVNYSYSIESAIAPSSFMVYFSNTGSLDGFFSFQVEVQGEFNHYSRAVSVQFVQPTLWFADSDGDGFGTSDQIVNACQMPVGYSNLSTDCLDNDATVYPFAIGTEDNVDNDCNGIIEDDELNYCADIDGDHLVTVSDIYILNGDIGCSAGDCFADINQDGFTDVNDLIILLSDFGEYCP